jgi:hypothetical protein
LAALLAGACLVRDFAALPQRGAVSFLPWILWGLGVAYVVACPVLALVYPARSIHDRLAGTYLVPK